VRILIDQSGYDLLNIGDVAMLQSCVARLRMQWPDAEIMVIAHDAQRLASFCPDTIAIRRTLADLPLLRLLPRRTRLATEQAWKMTTPYFSGRFSPGPIVRDQPFTAIQAVKAADLVVASGGAYVTDTWWWHASGVLSLLSLAQRLGKPTAMFGQGIGPISQRALHAQVGAVLPGLAVLGLREGRIGRDLALSLGIRPSAVTVTGDDAFELIGSKIPADGKALGVSVRVSGYSGVDTAAAAAICDLVIDMAAEYGAPVVGLPVSRYAPDAAVLRALFQDRNGDAHIVLEDIASPQALASAAAECRTIVTGSYHAAVFGLAQGVPAVCLTKSEYYYAKFSGLQALFPGACFVVSLHDPDSAFRLRSAVQEAWHLHAPVRTTATDTALQLRNVGREAYKEFRDVVNGGLAVITNDNSRPDRLTGSTVKPHSAPVPVTDSSERFSPARMMDVELTKPLPTVSYRGQRERLWVLGRVHAEPIGVCIARLGQEGLAPDQLAELLWSEFREPITERYIAAGLSEPAPLTGDGLALDPADCMFLRRRRAVLAAAPFISIVVCTRDRPDQLEGCLRSIGQQDYPQFEVVVVDNAPTSDAVRTLIDGGRLGYSVRYVSEPRPGLSWARNAGVAAAKGEIIAFLDDDEEPDRDWLAGLAGGFAHGNDIGCVSGMVLPARLDNLAQELFEQFGGHCKGRGFSSAIFSGDGPQSPLYPMPPFGVGANMAFRREVLVRIGGFDVALGAGTPALAGEDTLALTLTLLAGYRIAYEPAALMRHHHRDDLDSLSRQLQGYGVGLTAFYVALLRRRPRVLPGLLRLILPAVGYLRAGKRTRTATPQDLPAGLKLRQRWWMLAGPLAYLKSARKQARVADRQAHQV
jgi:polysaccharide pyruvyl transferase WcaK-like protein/GT2 family glycosyltransferase